jgi:biopolymer transport protein ExbD
VAKSKVFSTSAHAGDVSFNVVPLVDCAFLMILFFILTSQLSATGSDVLLPKPLASQGIKADQSQMVNKVIVNVISDQPPGNQGDAEQAGEAKGYEINSQPIALGDTAMLVKTFQARRNEAAGHGAKDFYVVIRGDWRVKYKDVAPVMMAASQAGIPKLCVVVLTGQ